MSHASQSKATPSFANFSLNSGKKKKKKRKEKKRENK